MKCTIRRVIKNQRYRILFIRGETYILDMGGASIWKILFPVLYWVLPNRVYQLQDSKDAEELMASTVKSKAGSATYPWIAAFSLVLGNMLVPLIGYFDVASSINVNITIVGVIVFLEAILIFFLNRMFKQYIYQIINLRQFPKGTLWVIPGRFKVFFIVIALYVLGFGFTLLSFAYFIDTGNWYVLAVATALLFVSLTFSSVITVAEGNAWVKFWGGKKAEIFPRKQS